MNPTPKSARWAAATLATYLLIYLSWQAFHWLPGDNAEVGNLLFLPIGTAAVLAALMASRRCAECVRLRWFWRLFALGLSAQVAGDLAMTFYDFGSGTAPFPSLADPPYLAFYLLIGLALLHIPVAPTTRPQRIRIGLDLLIILLGAGMAIWYLVLAPTVTEGGTTTLQMATSIAYPVGDVLVLGALGIVAMRWSPSTLQRPLALIAAGLSLFVAADLIYAYAVLHGAYTAGGPTDILWIGAFALFALAATQQRQVRANAPETSIPPRSQTESKVSWLPFGALVVGSITLLSAEWGQRLVPELTLLLAAVVLAGLIALRQFLAQGELIRLRDELGAAHDALAKLAGADPLTGIANRRSIDRSLKEELERAKRYGRSLSILFVDIDHFKQINDNYGHAAGDDALKEFAAVMCAGLRPADLPCRWGGEEFVVLLPEADRDAALRAAERIRTAEEDHTFSFADEFKLTCSIGASSFPDDSGDMPHLIELADHALYEAKRRGRNQVIAAEPIGAPV